jgi:hypothetical protein
MTQSMNESASGADHAKAGRHDMFRLHVGRAFRQSLFAGFLFFAIVMSMGSALAEDKATSIITGQVKITVASVPPEITQFDIRNAANTSSVLLESMDVLTTYRIIATVNNDNGWTNITKMFVNLWWDGDSTPEKTYDEQKGTGANFHANLSYTNAAPLDSPSETEWSVVSGNWVYDGTDSAVYTIIPGQKYMFDLSFQFRQQMRWGSNPLLPGGITDYVNKNSWNGQFIAMNSGGNVTVQPKNSADPLLGVYVEVGVFRYTEIGPQAPTWDAGSVAPGAANDTNNVIVTYASNMNYKLKAFFTTHLVSGTNQISATNIRLRHTGNATNDLAFADIGEASSLYIEGSSGAFQLMDRDRNALSVGVRFNIFVPFGTPSGPYVANVTVRVEQ